MTSKIIIEWFDEAGNSNGVLSSILDVLNEFLEEDTIKGFTIKSIPEAEEASP